MRLRDAIWIRTTPERVFGFFESMHENYLCWHTKHRLFRWEQGQGVRKGVVFYFEEEIGGTLMKKRAHFTAEIHIRTGPVGAWLNRREFSAVRQHIREEGESLKHLLEADSLPV